MKSNEPQAETRAERIGAGSQPGGAPTAAPGSIVGLHYRVVRTLGSGAMGIVILARDEVLERDVALKLIRPELYDDENARERFLSEARAMARVRHPNVVHIYAFGVDRRGPYLVMEYVDGPNLEQWLGSRGGAPTLGQAIGILKQLCAGVSAIHAAGTTHRDLKTSNVLLGEGFRVAVTDLGLARTVTGPEASSRHASGTPAYMAPEIALGEVVVPELRTRADIYSLGVIAYELLTGELPFSGENIPQTLQLHITEAPTPPSRRANVPSCFDDVVLRALAKEPSQRTESAEALAEELDAAFASVDDTEPLRFLVADDDAGFRSLISRVLAKAWPGATIEAVADGEAALDAAERRPPSVAVIDLDMPGLNGIELTAAIRALASTKRVPIVVATAVGGPADWRLLTQLGANAFLVKPFDPGQLVHTVEAIVGRASRWRPSR